MKIEDHSVSGSKGPDLSGCSSKKAYNSYVRARRSGLDTAINALLSENETLEDGFNLLLLQFVCGENSTALSEVDESHWLPIVAKYLCDLVSRTANTLHHLRDEVFGIILRDASATEARKLAQSLARRIDSMPEVRLEDAGYRKVGLRIGIVSHRPGAGGPLSFAGLLSLADRALHLSRKCADGDPVLLSTEVLRRSKTRD